MNKQMKKVLIKIGKTLNKENIVWAIGASLMLNQHGLYDDPEDIDIIVKTDDIVRAVNLLSSLGKFNSAESSSAYISDYFYKGKINDVEIDLIAGYKIKHASGLYEYNFDKNRIGKMVNLEGVNIPLCSLADWMEMYNIMPKGKQKAMLIKNHLDMKN